MCIFKALDTPGQIAFQNGGTEVTPDDSVFKFLLLITEFYFSSAMTFWIFMISIGYLTVSTPPF